VSFVSVYDRSQYFFKKYLTNTNVRPCLKLNTFTFIDEQRHGGKKNGRSLSRLGGDAQASAIREQGALRRPRVHETKQNGFDRFLFFFFLFFLQTLPLAGLPVALAARGGRAAVPVAGSGTGCGTNPSATCYPCVQVSSSSLQGREKDDFVDRLSFRYFRLSSDTLSKNSNKGMV